MISAICLFISCNRTASADEKTTITNIVELSKIHSQTLANFLDEIKSSSTRSDTPIDEDYLKNFMQRTISSDNYVIDIPGYAQTRSDQETIEVLSMELEKIYDRFDGTTSIEELKTKIEDYLESEEFLTCPIPYEMELTLCVIVDSFDYWLNNYDLWIYEFTEEGLGKFITENNIPEEIIEEIKAEIEALYTRGSPGDRRIWIAAAHNCDPVRDAMWRAIANDAWGFVFGGMFGGGITGALWGMIVGSVGANIPFLQ